MLLNAFADASYLCRAHARSVAGAIFFLATNTTPPESTDPFSHVFSTIIPCIIASAGEAEYVVLLLCCSQTTRCIISYSSIRHGLPIGPNIIMCDNTSAIGMATDSIKQKRSKAVDIICIHWSSEIAFHKLNSPSPISQRNKTW
jgi:hypothetical protein